MTTQRDDEKQPPWLSGDQMDHEDQEQRTPDHEIFADFDGVHIRDDSPATPPRHSHSPAPSFSGLLAMAAQELDYMEEPLGKSMAYVAPDDKAGMTYYPAPTPMTITLPPKLSRRVSPTDKRRSQLLAAGEDVSNFDGRRRCSSCFGVRRISGIFEAPPQELNVKGGMPTEILEQILSASVDTPTHAFTNHAFVGGPSRDYELEDFRGRSSKRSSRDPFHKRASSSFLNFAGFQSSPDRSVEIPADLDKPDSEASDHTPATPESRLEITSQRPNTLVAELKIRKQQQRARNKPALETFPDGAYTTLLDLDTVAEHQKRVRQQGRTPLAWERVKQEDAEDEIPLAYLYQDKRRPLQPRLGGMNSRAPSAVSTHEPEFSKQNHQQESRFSLQIPGLTDDPPRTNAEVGNRDDDEEETLAQRVRRLKAVNPRPPSQDFAREVLEQLGMPTSAAAATLVKGTKAGQLKSTSAGGLTGDQQEETLGQRRKRLQLQAQTQSYQQQQYRQSTSDALAVRV